MRHKECTPHGQITIGVVGVYIFTTVALVAALACEFEHRGDPVGVNLFPRRLRSGEAGKYMHHVWDVTSWSAGKKQSWPLSRLWFRGHQRCRPGQSSLLSHRMSQIVSINAYSITAVSVPTAAFAERVTTVQLPRFLEASGSAVA